MKNSVLSDHFIKLYKYNFSINQKLASYLNHPSERIPMKILNLACHISNAHFIWNSRILGESIDTKPWDSFPITEFGGRERHNLEGTFKILEEIDLKEIISYRNSVGHALENNVSDILTHVVNHGTYHRGQISLLLREKGFEPIPSDFIYLIRDLT
ncbi:damage-inducible protein DinB [Algoriphagus aestuarii]|nr:damage-inducible protein DinB [Algoriphagus aestuarii]